MSIAAFVRSKVGCGYIYGAKGQICSETFRQRQADQYPAQAANILGIGSKWDGQEVWECAQLTKAAAKTEGFSLPSGATSQWTKAPWARKGTIDTLPPQEVCFLYRRENGSSTVMAHTGISLGDGTCIHARGTAYGVVHQRMAQYAWTHWASLVPCSIAKDEKEGTTMQSATGTKMIVTTGDGNPLKMRADPSTKNKYLCKLPVGTAVQVLASQTEAGEQWSYVRLTDGSIGYVMSKYLALPAGEESTLSTTLPTPENSAVLTLPASVATALGEALRNAQWR